MGTHPDSGIARISAKHGRVPVERRRMKNKCTVYQIFLTKLMNDLRAYTKSKRSSGIRSEPKPLSIPVSVSESSLGENSGLEGESKQSISLEDSGETVSMSDQLVTDSGTKCTSSSESALGYRDSEGPPSKKASREAGTKVCHEAVLTEFLRKEVLPVPQSNRTVFAWLHRTLTHWLDDRSDQRNDSLLEETSRDIMPLLTLLVSDSLREDVLEKLKAIVEAANKQDYEGAVRNYIRLSVGTEPWPIGVGNCFIQERASMDKIASSSHLLNDQVTRKFVVCIKRLLTRCETYWPSGTIQ